MRPYVPRRSPYPVNNEVLRPVFGVDIDGTMGLYHEHFWKFAQGYVGKLMPHPDAYDGSCSFPKFLGISKATYREAKLAYRRGGLKRSMPAFPMASELTRGLRQRGAIIAVCTTRPFLQLDNVEKDTLVWLGRKRIQYDYVTSGEHKYRDLYRRFGEQVVAVVEDLPEMVRQANACGMFALLHDRTYNRPPVFNGGDWRGLRVEDLHEAAAEAHGMLDDWEEKNR